MTRERVRWKAVIADWNEIESYNDDEPCIVCLTPRQAAALAGFMKVMYWHTRWQNLPSGFDLFTWVSEIEGRLLSMACDCNQVPCQCPGDIIAGNDYYTTINVITNDNSTTYNSNPLTYYVDIQFPATPQEIANRDAYLCPSLLVYTYGLVRVVEGALNEQRNQICDDAGNPVLNFGIDILESVRDGAIRVSWISAGAGIFNKFAAAISAGATFVAGASDVGVDLLRQWGGVEDCPPSLPPISDRAIEKLACGIYATLSGGDIDITEWELAWSDVTNYWIPDDLPYGAENNPVMLAQWSVLINAAAANLGAFVDFIDAVATAKNDVLSTIGCGCGEDCTGIGASETVNIFDGVNGVAPGVTVLPVPFLDTTTFGPSLPVYRWSPQEAREGIYILLPYDQKVCVRSVEGDLYRTSVAGTQPSSLIHQMNGVSYVDGLATGDNVNLFLIFAPEQKTRSIILKVNDNNNNNLYLSTDFRYVVRVE